MSDSFVTPWTVAHLVPLPMGFNRQEYWSGLLFPTPGDPPNPGIKLVSPALAEGFFTTEPPGKTRDRLIWFYSISSSNRQRNFNLYEKWLIGWFVGNLTLCLLHLEKI